jgi:PKD repeat protein
MMTNSLTRFGAKCAALALVTAGAVSCGLENQSAPPLTGPSEFGLSLSLRATPDTIVADGQSQSAIQVTARGPNGNPLAGVAVAFDVFVDDVVEVPRLTQETVVTDANGNATTGLIAPVPPATQFASDPIVTVVAVPVGSDFGNASSRTVQVRVRAPEGTPPGSPNPVAKIVASRNTVLLGESISFDGSYSTYGGLACGNRCDYIWELPTLNADPVRGVRMERTFNTPGDFIVRLTITDAMGGVDSDQVTVRVIGPAQPEAVFNSSPASPRVGTEVMFDASPSTAGYGRTVSRYNWSFGDGTSDSRDTPRAPKVYTAAGTYTVTLSVTDSDGHQSEPFTSMVTVVP